MLSMRRKDMVENSLTIQLEPGQILARGVHVQKDGQTYRVYKVVCVKHEGDKVLAIVLADLIDKSK